MPIRRRIFFRMWVDDCRGDYQIGGSYLCSCGLTKLLFLARNRYWQWITTTVGTGLQAGPMEKEGKLLQPASVWSWSGKEKPPYPKYIRTSSRFLEVKSSVFSSMNYAWQWGYELCQIMGNEFQNRYHLHTGGFYDDIYAQTGPSDYNSSSGCRSRKAHLAAFSRLLFRISLNVKEFNIKVGVPCKKRFLKYEQIVQKFMKRRQSGYETVWKIILLSAPPLLGIFHPVWCQLAAPSGI